MDNNMPATVLQDNTGVEKDIIRVTSYQRRHFKLAVTILSPRDFKSIRSSIAPPFQRAPEAFLGRMDTLPLEIIYEILLLLDIESLFLLRRVNLRARQVLSTFHPFKMLALYAAEALCIIVKTKISPWYSLNDLYEVFRTRDCSCGSFGWLLFLPLFERCCFECLSKSPRFDVLPDSAVATFYGLSPETLRKSTSSVYSVPGVYSVRLDFRPARISIIANKPPLITGEFPNPTATSFQRGHDTNRFMAATALPFYDAKTGEIQQHGIWCAGCAAFIEKTEDLKMRHFDLRNAVYSTSGFLDHFKTCAEAQNLWDISNEGQSPVELPGFDKNGGFIIIGYYSGVQTEELIYERNYRRDYESRFDLGEPALSFLL